MYLYVHVNVSMLLSLQCHIHIKAFHDVSQLCREPTLTNRHERGLNATASAILNPDT